MKKTKAVKKDNRRLVFILCTLVMLIPAVLVPMLLKLHTQVQYSSIYEDYVVGQIAEKNVYAKSSIDLIDKTATEERIAEARRSVNPVFTYSYVKSMEVLRKADLIREAVAAFDYEKLVELLGETLGSRIMGLERIYILSASYDILSDILEIGYYEQHELDDVLKDGYETITLSNRYMGDERTFNSEVNPKEDFVERLLGRSLSPVEIAKIHEWVSYGYSDKMIIDALKEALANGKKSLRSVDKILLAWSQKEDLLSEGHTPLSTEWDKNLEETIRIAKTPWIKKPEDDD